MIDKNTILKELAMRELASRSLADFILYTYPEYKMGVFHKYLCDILDKFIVDIEEGRTPRLIVTAPPRHGKSEILSRRLPAYLLGKYPDYQIINTSYSADLACKMNLDVQKIMEGKLFNNVFPNVRLPKKGSGYKRDSEIFELIGGTGGLRSAGVGGGITGMGAHLFLIDDPVKDAKEAASETIQKNIWDWFTTTAYTRLMPKNGMIIIMTRWNLNDLVGMILNQQVQPDYTAQKFELINFPAIATSDEYINGVLFRQKGDALHSERYSLEYLNDTRARVGEYTWNALYQQNPVPDGGNIFKEEWFKFYKNEDTPQFDDMCISWDMSFKGNEDNDFVVGQVWGKRGANFYLVEEVRFQGGFTSTVDAVVSLHKKYPKVLSTLVEDKANGSAIIDYLKNEVYGLIPITPGESKQARAQAISPLFRSGNIYIPESYECQWVPSYMKELEQFPYAANDDRVDATSQALTYWLNIEDTSWARM